MKDLTSQSKINELNNKLEVQKNEHYELKNSVNNRFEVQKNEIFNYKHETNGNITSLKNQIERELSDSKIK